MYNIFINDGNNKYWEKYKACDLGHQPRCLYMTGVPSLEIARV
jgi:hypothetical protein